MNKKTKQAFHWTESARERLARFTDENGQTVTVFLSQIAAWEKFHCYGSKHTLCVKLKSGSVFEITNTQEVIDKLDSALLDEVKEFLGFTRLSKTEI